MKGQEMKPLVIYHANCTDGFTAAWIAARALGDVELFPGFYGTDPPDVTGRVVYVLDFSYKRPIMERLVVEAARLVVLDHHKTAEADLDGLVRGGDDDHAMILFDMNRSGARLAFEWFANPELPAFFARPSAEWLIDYVQDRDLWKWELEDSRLVSAGIEAVPKTLESWDALAARHPEALKLDGKVIEQYRRICIAAAVELARPMEIAAHHVLAANSSEMRFASDTAHELADGHPFGATYWVRADAVVQWSLRSRDGGGVDVSDIAKSFGGGGHKHAAGFQTPISYLAERLKDTE